jgi:hypothetical protein
MPWRIQLKIRQNAGQICQISVSDQLKVVRNLDWQLFLCVARPRSDTEKKLQSVQRCSVLTQSSRAGGAIIAETVK